MVPSLLATLLGPVASPSITSARPPAAAGIMRAPGVARKGSRRPFGDRTGYTATCSRLRAAIWRSRTGGYLSQMVEPEGIGSWTQEFVGSWGQPRVRTLMAPYLKALRNRASLRHDRGGSRSEVQHKGARGSAE